MLVEGLKKKREGALNEKQGGTQKKGRGHLTKSKGALKKKERGIEKKRQGALKRKAGIVEKRALRYTSRAQFVTHTAGGSVSFARDHHFVGMAFF